MNEIPLSVADEPLDEFSNCHAGILTKLDALERLPALLEPAALARRIASESLDFFSAVVYEHHVEEERDLFPAVLASAYPGDEMSRLQSMIERLTREHREVESAWERLKPHLKAVARGQDASIDTEALSALVAHYKGHARYEEAQFLPLCRQVLGRNGDHMAALGVAMHMRRTLPGVMERFGHRI